jgi:uncharacterized SAM-binding protein YcdF (DUF218 family)/lysophospholipase L1-like esterase
MSARWQWWNRGGKISVALKRWLLPFCLGLAAFPAISCAINRSPYPDLLVSPLVRDDTSGNADVIVVAGAGVTAACTPNTNSVRRVLLAAKLYREARAPLVMFAGGPSSRGPDCPVATVMAALAQSVGIPPAHIRTETASRSTWENARNSAPHLRALNAQRILVVTDRLHLLRTKASFERFGFQIEHTTVPVYEGNRDNMEMLYSALHELLGIWYYEARGWIRSPFDPPPAIAPTSHRGGVEQRDMKTRIAHPDGPLLILGASYAGNWDTRTLAGLPVINRGISGQQSFEFLGRFDDEVVPLRPRAVILWGFINDVFRAPRASVDTALERTKRSYVDLLARARGNGIEPILMTEVTVRQPDTLANNVKTVVGGWLGRPSYAGYINDHVLAVNAWLRDLARREGVLLLDIQPVISRADGRRRREYATADGSHISEAGYAAITEFITPILHAHLDGQ